MIAYFVRHPTAANLLMLIIILLGVLGLGSLNREVFPEFASDYINVRVLYKGASAEDVERSVCQRIEEEIEGIEGIEEVVSTAREGVGLLTIEVADGYELAPVLKDVENAVDQIDKFPDETETPIIWEFKTILPVCTVSVWSDAMSEKELAVLADGIKDEMLDLDDVSLVKTTGVSEHQIRVEVREADLLAQGITIGDVAREIRSQSLDLPAGSVESDEREINIRVLDQRRWAEDFRDLTVKVSPAGARIPLRAVATVRDTFEDEWTQTSFHGRRSVDLEVQKTDEEDTLRVAAAVRDFVRRRSATMPPEVGLTMWGDWSVYVKDRLGMLVKNGMYGFVLVFLTLWLMLNLRLSFWVAVGIPISFLGTLWVMDLSGMSLNMITMFALIMAVGIIVDDAIVIGENIYAHYSRGKPAAQAAVDGTLEVGLGVVASMLTTVAVFMPLFYMQGEIGKIMRVMPVAVITALAVSLVEAFLILPHHLRHSLGRMSKEPPRIRARIDRFVRWFTRDVYGPVLDWSARHPAVPIAGVIALLLIAAGTLAGGHLKFQLFPELDGDFVVAQVELPRGTELARTRAVVRQLEAALPAVDEHFQPGQPKGEKLIQHVSTSFGYVRNMDRGPATPETGSHLAQVIVQLLEADRRKGRCSDVLAVWRKTVGEVPDVVRLTYDQLQVTPGGKAIEIQLHGERLDALKQASLDLQHKIGTFSGVENLADDLRPGKEEVRVRLKPAARPLGITVADLAAQLRSAFWGNIAEEFQRGSDTFEVEVLFAPGDRRSLADLDDFKVRLPDGQTRPFHEVATYVQTRGYSQIVRVDGRRTLTVSADVAPQRGNASEIMAEIKKHYFPAFLQGHRGVSLDLEGQQAESAKTQGSILQGFAVGLAMIFILLSFVFKSYVEPLVVMFAIPFGFVGAVFGHLALGLDWTMPSTIGFVSLAGIVVNDSIVLVAFVKLRLQEGMGIYEAVHMAGMQRLRPVVLTSATTVAGLLPMMMESSLQAQFLIPMAVSISFGLMFATALVLLLVPCEYAILARFGWAQKVEVEYP